jgi:hypothetical protein
MPSSHVLELQGQVKIQTAGDSWQRHALALASQSKPLTFKSARTHSS